MARSYKCKNCGEWTKEPIKTPVARFCSYTCATDYAKKQSEKQKERRIAKENREQKEKQKAERTASQQRKKSITKLSVWQKRLRNLVQQYVLYVKDKGCSCVTCGNPIATEAGHYLSVGSRPELQFELTNIHPQCHECNVYKSGNRAEYDKFILAKYGKEHFEWLNGHHPELKVIFSTWEAYENEIKRYRNILRSNGIKPRV